MNGQRSGHLRLSLAQIAAATAPALLPYPRKPILYALIAAVDIFRRHPSSSPPLVLAQELARKH